MDRRLKFYIALSFMTVLLALLIAINPFGLGDAMTGFIRNLAVSSR